MAPGEAAAAGRHRRLADSDASDDDEPRYILTTAKASDLRPKPFRLIAKDGGFTSLEDMSMFAELDYINLSGNNLRTVHGLNTNARLKTLILKGNKLSDVNPILKISALRVLDISDNDFVTTEWLPRAAFAADLVALVARGNRLASLEGLTSLKNLQTLVISNNDIDDIFIVGRLTNLTKLSASNNRIRTIPDSFTNLHSLCELRIAHNKLSVLPSEEVLVRLSSLKILDIGHNRIPSFKHLEVCKRSLIHINIRGNPAYNDEENILQYMQSLCPKLEIIDGQRIAGGRRKFRVNRQRLEAGFPLEPERSFARPPPSSVLKELAAQNGLTDAKAAIGSSEDGQKNAVNGTAKKRRRESNDAAVGSAGNYEKKDKTEAVKPELEDEDDNVIDSQAFLQMAKSRAGSNLQLDDQKDYCSSAKPKKIRKKGHKEKGVRNLEIEFGAGGESKW